MTVSSVVAVVDCEARSGAFFEQTVNAWSSFAYVVAGAVIAARARQAPQSDTIGARTRPATVGPFIAFGVIVATEGIGSVLFHGTSWPVASFLHDVALVGLVGAVAGWHLGRATSPAASTDARARRDHTPAPTSIRRLRWRPAERPPYEAHDGMLIGLSCGVIAGIVTWAMPSAATNVAVTSGVATIVAAELIARRGGKVGMWHAPLLALAAGTAAAWVLGTSGSPVCSEESLLQFHAVWHVGSALLLMAWARRATLVEARDHPSPQPEASPTRR